MIVSKVCNTDTACGLWVPIYATHVVCVNAFDTTRPGQQWIGRMYLKDDPDLFLHWRICEFDWYAVKAPTAVDRVQLMRQYFCRDLDPENSAMSDTLDHARGLEPPAPDPHQPLITKYTSGL